MLTSIAIGHSQSRMQLVYGQSVILGGSSCGQRTSSIESPEFVSCRRAFLSGSQRRGRASAAVSQKPNVNPNLCISFSKFLVFYLPPACKHA